MCQSGAMSLECWIFSQFTWSHRISLPLKLLIAFHCHRGLCHPISSHLTLCPLRIFHLIPSHLISCLLSFSQLFSQLFSALRSSCQLVSCLLISSLLFSHLLSSSQLFVHLFSWSQLFSPHLGSSQLTLTGMFIHLQRMLLYSLIWRWNKCLREMCWKWITVDGFRGITVFLSKDYIYLFSIDQ